MLLMYVFSLIITQAVTENMQNKLASEYVSPANQKALKLYYGGIFQSMFSMFEALFGGQDWDVLVRPLMEEISPLMALVFLFYIGFGVLAMMNVVTGVFVENVLECTKKSKDIILINNVRELFANIDGGLHGFMSWEVFASKVETDEMQEAFKAINIDASEAQGLFNLLDLDGSRKVNAQEFLAGILRLRGPAKALDLAVLMREIKHINHKLSRHGLV